MITTKTALSFDRVRRRSEERTSAPEIALRDNEVVALEYLDAAVETGIWKDFDGDPFEFRVEMEQLAAIAQEPLTQAFVTNVLGALRRRYESREGGWQIGVFLVRNAQGNVVTVQMVFFAPIEVEPPALQTPVVDLPPVEESQPRRARVPGVKPRVLLVPDVPGWAFDVNARDLAETLGGDFDFDFFYTENFFRGERPRWSEWDVVYEFFHRNPPMGMPYDRAVGALRSEWWDPQRREPPTSEQVARVNQYRGFQVACQRNLDEFHGRCPRVVYLTNPVNTRRFTQTPLRDRVVPSWNGNAGHKSPDGRYIKHFYDIVVPACLRAMAGGVGGLVAAEYGTKAGPQRRRAPAEMPEFYQQANVALCASEYEAASNSVMEAMASGLALVATNVGNHRELQEAQLADYGDTGVILVDSDVNAFAKALRDLTPARAHEMGKINRASIERSWSWDRWAPDYKRFLEMAL